MKASHIFFSVLAAANALAILPSVALADSQITYNPNNGHWYQRFVTSMNWPDAKVFCERKGGYLATATTINENFFITYDLTLNSPTTLNGLSVNGIWLGATNVKNKGTTNAYQWITGESWSFTYWGGGQPDNNVVIQGGGENYVELWFNGAWNDIGIYNQGLLWGGPSAQAILTVCEWGGNFSSTNF